jgi:CRP-like cAMP-binding protein
MPSVTRERGVPTAADRAVFAAAVRTIEPMADADLALALSLLRVRDLKAGALLLSEGERASEVVVVAQGILREYFLLSDGTERTKAIILEGAFSGSLADLLSGGPSRAYIVAQEDARLLVARYADYVALAAKSRAWSRFARRSMELLLLRKTEREYELLALDAEARYAAFVERCPGLEARVPARHIASYLGITPVHLSRLRRRRRERRLARP